MSLFCAISGQPPLTPVLSTKSGHVYEKHLVLKYLNDNEGRDPVTGEALSVDDLVEIKTGELVGRATRRGSVRDIKGIADTDGVEALAPDELDCSRICIIYETPHIMCCMAASLSPGDHPHETTACLRAALERVFSNDDCLAQPRSYPASVHRTDSISPSSAAPSAPSAPPRAPTFTSVPSLLHTLQSEWDSTMLECLELRRAGEELRQELSHALYKEDAAMRVLARLTRERDEARE